MGPPSHEALCVHRCCQVHQLHPQRLLTQARHLCRAEPWGRGCPRAVQRVGLRVSNSLGRWVELRDSHTVKEGEGGLGDCDSTKSELHAHRDVVCKGREGARVEGWGGGSDPELTPQNHREGLALEGREEPGLGVLSSGHKSRCAWIRRELAHSLWKTGNGGTPRP